MSLFIVERFYKLRYASWSSSIEVKLKPPPLLYTIWVCGSFVCFGEREKKIRSSKFSERICFRVSRSPAEGGGYRSVRSSMFSSSFSTLNHQSQ